MSKAYLTNLQRYCPTGTAEGEKGIRGEIFVQFPSFVELVVPPAYSPRLLVGQKGCGKSLLVDFSLDVLQAKKIPCIKLRPVDLNIDSIPDNASIAQAHREAYGVLVRACAAALGTELTGLLNESENKLRDEAIAQGNVKPDVVSQLANWLPKVAKELTDVDISSLLPMQPSATVKELSQSLSESLSHNGKALRSLYIFIDDTDQVASPDKPTHLNRIWGLLLACRDLAQISDEIRCVVTLRQEVWVRITSDRAGNRDQTDHFKTLVRMLDPTVDELKDIIRRRLKMALKAAKAPEFLDGYVGLFENHRPLMPGGEAPTSWEDMIVTRSRGRPRDSIQLLNILATQALDEGSEKITERHVTEIIAGFSESRVDFLCQENEGECKNLKSVFKAFAPRTIYDEGSFKLSSGSALKTCAAIPSSFSLTLFGHAHRPGNIADAYALWSFLFRIGFLNARVARPGGRYLHIPPVRNPGLVSETNQNQLQSITWEVHPAFRDYLISEQSTVTYVRR
ncbi:P-loop ATPase, Sll1717 family [Paraburkholderia caledonica]|uniref:P-loop ATPase, Sll1717 family n=1 Tax=Paraburkholderia caledonica TaxID=134536 RepID=UPI000DEECD1E|nr:hypothetical protein [Paraburkholderia caledonica]AXF14804.1 hypothetical protein CUJ87_10585 [Paraburkholderia caledonica]